MGDTVRFEVEGAVGTIRLDRPPANAIDRGVSSGLLEAVREVGARDDVRAVVIWGGDKMFAAGADVREMIDLGPEEAGHVVGQLNAALNAIEALPKVVIAAINGFALGGGLELAMAADLRYASANAKLGQPEIRLGIIPGAGGTQRLPRLVGLSKAREMIYTGRHVGAEEASALGLVDKVLPPGDVYSAALEAASAFASGPVLALGAAKRALLRGADGGLAGGLAVEREEFVALFATEDQKIGMRALLAKGEAEFKGR